MVKNNTLIIVIVVIVILVALFIGMKCKFQCAGYNVEGYKRAPLGGDCYGLQRTPVDYAEKNPNGWQRNPQYQSKPSVKYQPLEYGPVDLWDDGRRLEMNNGVLFQQYRNDWRGCGKDLDYLVNDEKNRFDLENIGAHGMRVQLDDMYNLRFGPKGIDNTEFQYQEPNPYFDKIYGGRAWLTHDKIGD